MLSGTSVTHAPATYGRPRPKPSSLTGSVRVEVAMSRDLFDRLTNHDHAPICRYDMASGLAEFVAEPGMAHESRSGIVTRLFNHIEFIQADAGKLPGFLVAPSARLLSVDGAFEPDTCIFIDPACVARAERVEGYLDMAKGHPAPDLVVEIDRTVDSAYKLVPYFRMGVREAWTWSPADGVVIWLPDADTSDGLMQAEASQVFPGVTRDDLDRLLAGGSAEERFWLSRELARKVVGERH